MDQTIPFALPGFSDPVSSWSHLLGAGFCLIWTFFLVRRGRGWVAQLSLALFGFSCVFLLSMSGTFHLLPRDTEGRAVLQRLDHAGIFLLIAGTFTPIHVILFRGWRRWAMLGGMWTATALGITLKTIFFHDVPESVGLFFYLGLGWVGAVSAFLLWQKYGLAALELPLAGAVCYTVGALLEFFRWPVVIPGVLGPHELFHLLVLGGVAAFGRFIWELAPGDWEEKGPAAEAAEP